MKIYYDSNYGADADGNRGISITEYELEYTEEEYNEIAEILFENGYTSEDSGTINISYMDLDDIEVKIDDYKDEIYKLEKEDGQYDDIPDLEAQLEEADRIRDARDDVGDQIHEQRKAEKDDY